MRFSNLSELDAANAKALEAFRAGIDRKHAPPYFGYYVADLFDCPPFILFTNNDCPRALDILCDRSFEPGSMALWCHLARSATAVLDIGAHVGVYSLAAAALRPDLAIHAFEPNPYAFARLRMHKHVNGFANIVEHACALANKSTVTLIDWLIKPGGLISSGTHLAKLAQGRDGMERHVVLCERLDAFDTGAWADRALMKIDVEGAEEHVFQGMAAALQHKPDIILETFQESTCEAINAMILPLGYQVFTVNEQTGALTAQDRLRPMDPQGQDYNQFLTAHPEHIEAA